MKKGNLWMVGLLVSHLVGFGVAFAWAGKSSPDEWAEGNGVTLKRSDLRSGGSEGEGALLLADFVDAQAATTSPYEELKKSLPVASDPKEAAMLAIGEWFDGADPDREEALAILKVRILHWMGVDPEGVLNFLTNGELPGIQGEVVFQMLSQEVFFDAIREAGVLESLSWLKTNRRTISQLKWPLLNEMKDGGGLALLKKVEDELEKEEGYARQGGPMAGDLDFFRMAGQTVDFADRQQLLSYDDEQTGPDKRHYDLLLGFSQRGAKEADWVFSLLESGEIEGDMATELRAGLGHEVLNMPDLEMDQRVMARRATEGNETKDEQSIINEIVRGDVNKILVGGRDWRYEFRNGLVSADDILRVVTEGLPGVPEEGKEEVRVSLYRQLAEENPAKALRLLDELPEEKRREILFNGTWTNFGNVDPNRFLAYMSTLPEAVTPMEKDERIKGWDWKARGFLGRYGDDYVEWVKQMPQGLDRDRAMNSLVWATREQNPEKARLLSEELYGGH